MHAPTLTSTHASARPTGVVLFLHGGREAGTTPVERRHASWWRIALLQRSVASRLSKAGVSSSLLRYRLRGWNAEPGREPDPVVDARWAVRQIRDEHPGLPIVLVGHSMGGRTACAVADEDPVAGVCGLAPWLPPEEPVSAIAGRPLVVMHGTADRFTSSDASRVFTERAARAGSRTWYVPRPGVGHYMLRGAQEWNDFVVTGSLGLLGVEPQASELAANMTS